MNREEIKKTLGEGATEEQVTNILNFFHTSGKVKDDSIQELKNKIETFNDYEELKEYKTKTELEKMTDADKMKADKELTAKNLKESKKIVNEAKARNVLAGLNISDEIINALVSDDEEKTVATATKLAEQMNSLKENTKKETLEAQANLDVKPPLPNREPDNEGMTWNKFKELSLDDQNKFGEENPDVLRNLK